MEREGNTVGKLYNARNKTHKVINVLVNIFLKMKSYNAAKVNTSGKNRFSSIKIPAKSPNQSAANIGAVDK